MSYLRIKLAYSLPAKWLSRAIAKEAARVGCEFRPAWLRDKWAGF